VMVSGSESSMRWAAERLLPVAIGSGPGWDDMRSRLEMYAETAEKAGHPRDEIERAVANTWQLRQVHVAETTEQAVAEFEENLMWYMDALANRAMFGFSKERRSYRYYVEHGAIVLGSPEKVLEDLLEYNSVTGVNNVICWFSVGNQPHEQVMRAQEYFGADIIPNLRDVEIAALASG
jgi:alkanesulfonate monooxygenase SsuD/methylene tetrahydromethanopterin reductase-like flavin-dependent oxidoreductase (luciferase family)